MNEINDNSKLFNVKSNLDWPVNFVNGVSTSYDVYTVYEVEKHYLWCLDKPETTLEKLGVAVCFIASVLVLCFCVFVVF